MLDESLREPVADRVLEGRLAQDRRVGEAREHRCRRARLPLRRRAGPGCQIGSRRLTSRRRIIKPGLLHWFSPVSIDAAHGGSATAFSQLKSAVRQARAVQRGLDLVRRFPDRVGDGGAVEPRHALARATRGKAAHVLTSQAPPRFDSRRSADRRCGSTGSPPWDIRGCSSTWPKVMRSAGIGRSIPTEPPAAGLHYAVALQLEQNLLEEFARDPSLAAISPDHRQNPRARASAERGMEGGLFWLVPGSWRRRSRSAPDRRGSAAASSDTGVKSAGTSISMRSPWPVASRSRRREAPCRRRKEICSAQVLALC